MGATGVSARAVPTLFGGRGMGVGQLEWQPRRVALSLRGSDSGCRAEFDRRRYQSDDAAHNDGRREWLVDMRGRRRRHGATWP